MVSGAVVQKLVYAACVVGGTWVSSQLECISKFLFTPKPVKLLDSMCALSALMTIRGRQASEKLQDRTCNLLNCFSSVRACLVGLVGLVPFWSRRWSLFRSGPILARVLSGPPRAVRPPLAVHRPPPAFRCGRGLVPPVRLSCAASPLVGLVGRAFGSSRFASFQGI